jgi:hypothetical protein
MRGGDLNGVGKEAVICYRLQMKKAPGYYLGARQASHQALCVMLIGLCGV